MTLKKGNIYRYLVGFAALCSMAALAVPAIGSEDEDDYEHKPEAQDFIHGQPETISEPWVLAAGGRIYDNWWEALDREEPEGTHPSYPATGRQKGEVTWRCKECHGWDYLGKDGIYSKGSHFTGIVGINGAIGKPVDEIKTLLRSDSHRYTPEMIDDQELERIAAFVSRGQVDMTLFLDMTERKVNKGDIDRGRGVFQTVCAACHGFDGRLLDWGSKEEPGFVGTEAVDVPDEVMNKILNAHPGVQMANLRAFPLDVAIDVLAYAATLPVK